MPGSRCCPGSRTGARAGWSWTSITRGSARAARFWWRRRPGWWVIHRGGPSFRSWGWRWWHAQRSRCASGRRVRASSGGDDRRSSTSRRWRPGSKEPAVWTRRWHSRWRGCGRDSVGPARCRSKGSAPGSRRASWGCPRPPGVTRCGSCSARSTNPAVPSVRSRPPKRWRTCGRSFARRRRASHPRSARSRDSRADRGDARSPGVPARPRPRAARGRAGHRQDPAGAHLGAGARREISAHPVHARPDARGHHGGHAVERRAGVHVSARAHFRRPRARRRDQPGPGENAGRAARSDAGAHRHRGRCGAPAVRHVHRVRDAEPRRVRRHLSAPRGRARPVHGQGAGGLPRLGRRARRPRAHRAGLRGGPAGDLRREPGNRRGRPGAAARRGRRRAGRVADHRLHRGRRPGHACGRLVHAGREPTGGRGAPQGGARGGAPGRPRLRDSRRREAPGPYGAAPPRERRARARARGRHAGRGAEGDPRQDRCADRVTPLELLAYLAIIAAFWGIWYFVGTRAGVLWTPRGLWCAAGCALAGLASLGAMLVADVALVVAVWLDAVLAARPGSAGLGVSRDAPPAFSVGREAAVSYRLVNGTRRIARLRVRELRPDVLGGPQPPRRIAVPPLGTARDRVSVRPARRGRERGGGFALDSIGPLGLGARRERIDLPWDAAVYPPLVTARLQASVARAQRRREQGITPLRQLGEGRLFESLRDWVPGDDLRHIDWKATARRGKVITRQYEAERRQQVLLVLDTGRLLTAEIAGLSRLDYVVRAALELAYAATQHDDNVGVMAFADGVQHFVAPQRGRAALKRVLDVLATIQPTLVEPDYPGAFRYLAARNRKRALTVLFSDVIDRFASDALVANVASLRPRHLPLAVTLKNPELEQVATLRPAVAHDAFRKAAAEELLRAREEALTHMRRAGVLVLDVAPQRAAEAVVAQYLELKRRGRL